MERQPVTVLRRRDRYSYRVEVQIKIDNFGTQNSHRLRCQPPWGERSRRDHPGSRLFGIWVCAFFAYRATTLVGQVLLTGNRHHPIQRTRDYLKRLRKLVDRSFSLMANSSSASV